METKEDLIAERIKLQNRIEEINDKISEIDKPKVGDVCVMNNDRYKFICIMQPGQESIFPNAVKLQTEL